MLSHFTRLLVACAATVFAAGPYAANADSLPDFSDVWLNPDDSYGFVWTVYDEADREIAEDLIANMTDVNDLVDLALDGAILVKELHRFDTDTDQTVALYRDVDLDNAGEGGQPGALGKGCGMSPSDIGVRSGVDRDSYRFDPGNHWEIRYYPGCGECSRFSKGYGAGRANKVYTDFYWRSGHYGSLHHWTSQYARGSREWLVGLWVGDNTINFMQMSCTGGYNSLKLKWW